MRSLAGVLAAGALGALMVSGAAHAAAPRYVICGTAKPVRVPIDYPNGCFVKNTSAMRALINREMDAAYASNDASRPITPDGALACTEKFSGRGASRLDCTKTYAWRENHGDDPPHTGQCSYGAVATYVLKGAPFRRQGRLWAWWRPQVLPYGWTVPKGSLIGRCDSWQAHDGAAMAPGTDPLG